MKKYPLLIFLTLPILSIYSVLNAVGIENENMNIQSYCLSDYDPGIPPEWIKPDGTFGE